jgi:putative SOS response-associated peptidase YedK
MHHVPMCGRYAAFLPAEAVARLFRTVNPLPNAAPSWNVAPTQDAMVVRRHPETGERHLDLLKWGILPSWTKDPGKAQRPINVRSETVATSGLFRGAFKARRCIVPADAFYEWKATETGKQPFAIARQDGQPMAFAGLWEGFRWPDGTITRTFTIATTKANADVAALHERMPGDPGAGGLAYMAGRNRGGPGSPASPFARGDATDVGSEPARQRCSEQRAGPAGADRRSANVKFDDLLDIAIL